MFTRLTFGTVPPLANSDHLVGALVITVAMIATAEVARPLRFLVVGLVVIVLSLPRGPRSKDHYASWDRFIV